MSNVEVSEVSGVISSMKMRFYAIFFGLLMLCSVNVVQESFATVCFGWEIDNPQYSDSLVFLGTVKSSSETKLDEPIQAWDYQITHRFSHDFKVDEVLFGNETQSNITVTGSSSRSGNELESGKQYLIITNQNYGIDWCSGYILTPSDSDSAKHVQDQIITNHLQKYYVENARTEKCGDGLFPILKDSDYSFNCVKLDSVSKLVERGWGTIDHSASLSWDFYPIRNFGESDVHVTLNSDKTHYKYPDKINVSGQFDDFVGKWISYKSKLIPIDEDNKFNIQFDGDIFEELRTSEYYYLKLRMDRYHDAIQQVKISYVTESIIEKLEKNVWTKNVDEISLDKSVDVFCSTKPDQDAKTHSVGYDIVNAQIINATRNDDIGSLIISILPETDGSLYVELPRVLIDAKHELQDDEFFVLHNGEETEFTELTTNDEFRLLEIVFDSTVKQIEIIGTLSHNNSDTTNSCG